MKPIITLEEQAGGWKVTFGNRWQDRLCPEEALGTIAEILYTGNAHFLKTQEQHDAWRVQQGFTKGA